MDSAISLCLGLTQAIRQAVRSRRPDEHQLPQLQQLTIAVMGDTVIRIGEIASCVLRDAWADLEAGRIEEPRSVGLTLNQLLGSVGEALNLLNGYVISLRSAGLSLPERSDLQKLRSDLDTTMERFREYWPLGLPDDPDLFGDEVEVGPEVLKYELGTGD